MADRLRRAGDRDGRGTLGAALAAQGWISCGQGLASATWTKGQMNTVVSESSGAPDDFIRVAQRARGISDCA